MSLLFKYEMKPLFNMWTKIVFFAIPLFSIKSKENHFKSNKELETKYLLKYKLITFITNQYHENEVCKK
jgi:hypothetical protein